MLKVLKKRVPQLNSALLTVMVSVALALSQMHQEPDPPSQIVKKNFAQQFQKNFIRPKPLWRELAETG